MKEKVMAALAILVLVSVLGGLVHNEFFKDQVVVVVDLKDDTDPFITIPNLLPRGEITRIREVDKTKNEYAISVSSKRERVGLLNMILGNSSVENAEFK